MRPGTGVVPLALEVLAAGDVRDLAGRQAADAGDYVLRGNVIAMVGLDLPAAIFFAVPGGGDPRVELDVAAEVEAVSDVGEVAQDLRLLRVLAAPLPLLQQVLVKGEAVHVGLR